jgi:hypothetical protein
MEDFNRERTERLQRQSEFSSSLKTGDEYIRFYQVRFLERNDQPGLVFGLLTLDTLAATQLLQQSFARPRRTPKFIKFLIEDCKLGDKAVRSLSKRLVQALDFIVTDHVRCVVEKAAAVYDANVREQNAAAAVPSPQASREDGDLWIRVLRNVIEAQRQ